MFRSLWQQVLCFRIKRSELPYLLQGGLIDVIIGWLFYDSVWAMIVFSPIVLLWTIHQRHIEQKKSCRALGIQFRDLIYAALTNLRAGYSIENAFVEAKSDMQLLYGDRSEIVLGLNRMIKGLKNNVPLEKLIFSLGKESGNSDIQDFAQVFAIAKRSGGNMTEIIERTINTISQKLNVEKEIEVIVSAKRMEAKIMNIVPFFIIFYIRVSSPGFFDVLYHNVFGVVLMSVCVAVYFVAYLMSEKIVNIDI